MAIFETRCSVSVGALGFRVYKSVARQLAGPDLISDFCALGTRRSSCPVSAACLFRLRS